jgi:dihydroflavonol-4-reductase
MTTADNAFINVLVTGAAGFIGSNLVEALVQRGYAVTCLVRSTSKLQSLNNLPIRLAVGDLRDPATLRKAVQGIHTVYHIAGMIKAASRDDFLRGNQLGTRNLLEALGEVNPGLKHFVHMSSLSAAGPSINGNGLIEENRPNPVSWYGESKLLSEQEVLRFSGIFPVVVLRPSAVYGPRDKETLMVFRMIRKGFLLMPRRYERRFSLIHVRDLTDAFIRAGESEIRSGEIFFVSRPEVYSWEDVGRAIADSLGKPFRRLLFPQWMARAAGLAGDVYSRITSLPTTISSQKVNELLQPAWICDSSKARRIFGFSPVLDLQTGIQQTVRWYCDHGWL